MLILQVNRCARVSKSFHKSLIITVFACFATFSAFAQFGNEWIVPGQSYFKIPVGKDGIYRLTYTDLQNAGFPVGSIDPRRLQLFHRGVEQRIAVQGESDAALNPGDYLEFYGKRNDGTGDAGLYQPVSAQPHPYYNLYSDTTAYFLTVNSAAPGLRMIPFSEISAMPPEIFHTDQKLMVLTSQYCAGKEYNSYLINSFFDIGEGWTGDILWQGEFIDYVVEDITDTSPASGNPQLEVQVVGRADIAHRVEISVGPVVPSRVVGTASFSGAEVVNLSAVLNWTDVGADGKLVVRVRAVNSVERLSASYVKVNFPQTFNQSGAAEKIFSLTENAGNKSYIEIQNAPGGTRLFDITNPGQVIPIGTTLTSTLNAVINNTSTSRKILATNSFITPSVVPVSFRSIDPTQHDYLIISHQKLMKPAGEYSNVVKAYGGYRASAAGGSYDTLVVDVNQLYNQFNYGEISPLAIRRFVKFMLSTGNPRYLFIIGKGLDVWYNYNRSPNGFNGFHDLVPSAGQPASDILLTAGLSGNGYEPALPTGRITANTPSDVAAYLNKVKEMEVLPFNDLWRKELLHLSGGINPGEPEQFKLYMEQFEAIAESQYLGGHVTAIPKNSTDIEFVNISDQVNKGLNLITLFGHSSPSQNDFNIGFVSAPELGYNNQGKYPMFLINGCNAGDFFADAIRYGEDWINTPNKGAVGFMANSWYSYSSLLRVYSNLFYATAYGDSVFIHKGIGDIQKEVVKKLTNLGTSVPYVTQGQQLLLLGDPSVKLFGANKPDYETNPNHVYIESYSAEPVTALSDSFAIKIIVRNFGRTKEDSLAVRVVRQLSNNTTITYDSVFAQIMYRDTLTLTLYRDENGFGTNTFTVQLDPLNEINEIEKSNNTAEFNFFIPLNAARNLYPNGFAVVNTASVQLVVQSTDVIGEARDFVVQLDTLDSFDSPYAQQFTVNGTIATLNVPILTSQDTLAFYWRTRLAQPLANESTEWTTSSFTYIKNGPEGWAQVHFPQLLGSKLSGLVLDAGSRQIKLKETVTHVDVYTFGADHPSPPSAVSVKLNGAEYNPVSYPGLQCRDNTLNLIVFDKTTTVPYMPLPVQYPNKKACGRRPEVITSFRYSEMETGANNLIDYINNVQLGDSVVLFSIGDAGYASWSASVRAKLGELGISAGQISALQAGEPVVIFAKKGAAAGTATLIKTSEVPVNEQPLPVSGTVTGRNLSGSMTSTIIGPAVNWQNLFTQVAISEFPVTDEFSFDVVGISMAGQETLLKSNITGVWVDISDIDAGMYPYLKLIYHAADEINLTPPQLKKWLVAYTAAAEGVLTIASPDVQNLEEGEDWEGLFGFRNISLHEFSDSLTVHYNIFNANSRVAEPGSKKIKAPAPGQETSFNISTNTENKVGLNDVKVYVNPKILPELYYENNVVTLNDYLNVQPDIYPPVLDVTIDGRHVVNGDYVSPNPAIEIKVRDENSALLKTDTTGVKIFLKYPCDAPDCPFTAIYFKRPDVQWSPATIETDFIVQFKPQNLQEGVYVLRVEASDERGNKSGVEPYEISFYVTEMNSISFQKPYPNPSSSIFYFTFVITGDDRPDGMSLAIINSNGQTVGEYSGSDFFTGTNKISWDAGNQPGGLYLYRLVVFKEGKRILSSEGKLMLIR